MDDLDCSPALTSLLVSKMEHSRALYSISAFETRLLTMRCSPSTQLVEKKQMLRVSRGFSWVNSGERAWGSDSPVKDELSTWEGREDGMESEHGNKDSLIKTTPTSSFLARREKQIHTSTCCL